MKNLILSTDSYKLSHYLQYPPKTEYVFSYIEARGNRSGLDIEGTLFFGLQGFIKKYLLKPITVDDINEAEEIVTKHGLPFNREGWEYIVQKYDGYLPLEIKAVREGHLVPFSNVLVTVENTDPKLYWLTSYIETALLRAVWYPTTVATISFYVKRIIKKYLDLSCDSPDEVLPFKLHDFGARGASSSESAEIGGAAHLVNFMGTDTIESIRWLMKYYNTDVPAFSIPAMEHSTVTAWGTTPETEKAAFKNMIQKFAGENKIYACVSDSFNLYDAVEKTWGEDLRYDVISSGGTVVIRPDSGDPVKVTEDVIEILGKKFGYTKNKKGYKVLHPAVRIIQGDGVDPKTINAILANYLRKGWSAENITFGMGGALLQKVNRDTFYFAMKASNITVDGKSYPIYKRPQTDLSKQSKKGKMKLVKVINSFETVPDTGWYDYDSDIFTSVYKNGELLVDDSLDTIRKRSEEYI